MNFLGAYSDSDDSDTECKSHPEPVKVTPKEKDKRVSTPPLEKLSGNRKPPKKRKKLDISFLPDNIQAALTRGGDESSDEEELPQPTKSDTRNSSSMNSSSALFSILPKPVNSGNEQKPETPPKASHSVTNETEPRENKKEKELHDSSVYVEDDVSCSDSDTELEATSNSQVPQSKSKSSLPHAFSVSEPSHTPVAPRPALINASEYLSIPKETIPQNSTVNMRIENRETLKSSDVMNRQGLAQLQNQYHGGMYTTGHHDTFQQIDDSGTAQKSSRRREREFQNKLLRGDINAAMGIGGTNVKDIKQHASWDDTHYREQQQREKELQTMFGASSNMVAQPTKNQNRKHHINSLMYSAAASELELLEAKGRQMKTKSETQAKYGW